MFYWVIHKNKYCTRFIWKVNNIDLHLNFNKNDSSLSILKCILSWIFTRTWLNLSSLANTTISYYAITISSYSPWRWCSVTRPKRWHRLVHIQTQTIPKDFVRNINIKPFKVWFPTPRVNFLSYIYSTLEEPMLDILEQLYSSTG